MHAERRFGTGAEEGGGGKASTCKDLCVDESIQRPPPAAASAHSHQPEHVWEEVISDGRGRPFCRILLRLKVHEDCRLMKRNKTVKTNMGVIRIYSGIYS